MNKRLLIQPTAAVQPGDIWVFSSNGVTAFQRPRDGSLYLKHGKTIQPLTESELKALVAAAVEQTQIAQEVDRLLPGLPKVARATVIQNVHAKTSLVNAATAQVALDKICHRGGVRAEMLEHTNAFFGPGHVFVGLQRGHYKVIYADPAWSFATWSHRGQGKGASQHYSCMGVDEICALPVGETAAEDAVMFLWVTQPMLPEAMRVVESWGFAFRTVGFIWIKMPTLWTPESGRIEPRLGLGYHTRSGSEQCWLCTRGKGYVRKSQGVAQVIHSPLRAHSQKPDEIAQRIEQLVGDVPRLELFARTRRPGWSCWGNEVGDPAPAVEVAS